MEEKWDSILDMSHILINFQNESLFLKKQNLISPPPLKMV